MGTALSTFFVIMGARVGPGGRPSGSLRRRIDGAWALASHVEDARFLPTGGIGEHPPAEAIVIRDALVARGADPDHVLIEDRGTDTLSSVRYCTRILREHLAPGDSVVVCSDRYHVLRCMLLFRIAGIPARMGRIRSSLPDQGLRSWLYYWVRDLAALGWDVPQALFLRVTGRL